MAYLRIRNLDNQIILDAGDVVPRFLGQLTITTNTGSINDPLLLTGIPFYQLALDTQNPNHSPTISFSGEILSWNFGTRPVTNSRLTYGVHRGS